MFTSQDIWRDIERLKRERPLVHNITNYVVMNTTANALLALGASPVMAHAVEEVEEMAGLASSLVINIGTLSAPWIRAMERAAVWARGKNIPFVLDPVGAGATRFRTETALRLIAEGHPAIIRANASEVLAISRAENATKGVDSRHGAEEALAAAKEISKLHGCVVSVSGAVDVIVFGEAVVRVANGHPMMPRITGMGCAASALTGAFLAVNSSSLDAAVQAMAVMGIAGELAGEGAEGPGSFQVRFLDALYNLKESDFSGRLKIEKG